MLLGMYSPILLAIKTLNWHALFAFSAGCVAGLLCCAKLIRFFLTQYRIMTMAILCGVLNGSLVVLWPWRLTQLIYVTPETTPIQISRPVSPFSIMTDPQLMLCVLCCGAGFCLICVARSISPRRANQSWNGRERKLKSFVFWTLGRFSVLCLPAQIILRSQ